MRGVSHVRNLEPRCGNHGLNPLIQVPGARQQRPHGAIAWWRAHVAPLIGMALTVCVFLLLADPVRPLRADDSPPSTSKAQGSTPAAQSFGRIVPDTFLTSPFAEFFKSGDYPRALRALEALTKEYPDDPLLLRYRAMVLDRLGRTNEAIALYQVILTRDPTHTPTHFFLGQAYDHNGNRAVAIREWRWVVQNSPSEEYRRLAEEELSWEETKRAKPIERERFYLLGDMGVEYDSNPRLKPNDKELAVPGNEMQAERFSFNLGLGYRLATQPTFRSDITYTTRQSLHDRGLNDVNFTSQELAFDARKRISFWDRDVILGSRYEFLVGFLEDALFSLTNRMLFSSDMRVTPHTRTYAYNRLSISDFGPDGSNPPQTSRDGVYDDIGLTQYIYTEDFRRYLSVGQEFNVAQTRGANFTLRGTTTRVGVHTPCPFVKQTDLDVSGAFRFGTYPRFTSVSASDSTRRQDTNWDLLTALTHYWTAHLATRVFYRWLNANNRNDFFQYDRHMTGVQLLFSQSF